MTKRALFPVLAIPVLVLCLPSDAFGHGGMWRGPYGLPPGTRMPMDPIPSPLPVPTPQPVPTLPGTPEMPRAPTGPGALPSPPTAAPGLQPNVPTPGGRRAAPTGPGLDHWVYWWNLNRERILGLRGIRASRLRSRTEDSSPHFLGKGGQGNRMLNETPEARDAILETLMAAAGDGNRDVSTGAVLALGKAGDSRAVPLLMKLSLDTKPHFSVNESAVLALGMIGSQNADVRGFLTGITKDPNVRRRTRAFAALGLGFLGDAGALPALMTGYRDRGRSREVPAAALLALGLLGDELVVPDLARVLAGPAETREKDDYLRAYAAAALGMIRSRAGVPALLSALRDRDKDVRRQAVLSLGALLGPDDVRPIKNLLHVMGADRDPQVRAYAAVSLGEIGAPATADNLLYAYRKGDSLIVPYAALGLGLLSRKCGEPTVVERIRPFLRAQFLERGNADLRGALAIALGMAGDREAVDPLTKIVDGGGDPQLRGHAAVALGLIGADSAIPALRSALTDRNDPDVQREVALALGLLADREAVRLLSNLVRNGRTEYVRGSAAAALGRLASPDTAESLRDALADVSQPATTRAFVAVALGMVMDPHPIPLLARLGEHFNHRMATEAVAEVLTFL